MGGVASFLTRRQGYGRMSLADWLSYSYLLLGLLVIFIPVAWLALNSVKTPFQIEKQDISLIPGDFERVGRATVHGPEGRKIFILKNMPDWVLTWRTLSEEEKASLDVRGFLETQSGDTYYALRSHLGLVAEQALALIAEKNLPDWTRRYATMPAASRAEVDVDATLAPLSKDERRLMMEFLGIPPFRAASVVAQVLVIAPHPDTGEIKEWAVPDVTARKPFLPGRALDDPSGQVVRLPAETVSAERNVAFEWGNYIAPLRGTNVGATVNFTTCITNSVLVTVIATLLTLLINSMAAFALSKYQFRGQVFFLTIVLATLLIPPSIALVGLFKAINATGLSGSIWGVIIPGAATPAGVFLLRQYMLTIPEELIEAARMDGASEWKIYWKIVLPLALPAIAALGILSIVWRWNDLITPMVAIATVKEAYTIQLCLLEFQGEHVNQEHFRLAMTVVSLIPTTLVFVFLQRYITTGIANTGMK